MYLRIISLFKKHWLGFVLSMLVGCMYIAPNVMFLGSGSADLPLMQTDAESMYLSRINAVYSGCVFNCNPYIKEYKSNYPFFNSSVGEVLLAVPGVVFQIPVIKLKVLYEFFLPLVLFLLVYGLMFRLSSSKIWSILAAACILLGYNLFNSLDLINIPDLLQLTQLKTDHNQFLLYSRPVNPQLSTIVFFIYLHCLLSAVREKSLSSYVALVLVYGFSFYIYFFTYAFITVVQGVWIGIYVLQKEWTDARRFASTTFLGILLGSPVLYGIYTLFKHPYYQTIPTEYLLKSHVPHIGLVGLMILGALIAMIIVYVKKSKSVSIAAYFVVALVTACFLVRNEHVVSGLIMQYDHFDWYYFTPVFIVTFCFFGSVFIGKNSSYGFRSAIWMLIAIVFLNAALIQHASYHHVLVFAQEKQRYVRVLDWLKDQARVESVVSAPERLASLIPLYTDKYVLWSFYAGQWVSVPGRREEVAAARSSAKELLRVGQKYGAEYYVEEKKNDIFIKDGVMVKKVYEDEYFTIYEPGV